MPKLIDTHTHINFKDFKGDSTEVIKRAHDAGVWLIVPASELKSSQRAVEYAEKYEKGVYAAVGLHPFHVWTREVEGSGYKLNVVAQVFYKEDYEPLLKSEKVVAIGEIGLDYCHMENEEDRDEIILRQKHEFMNQMRFAYENNKPVIVHVREAQEDCLSILEALKKENKLPDFVMHCYHSNLDFAKQYMEFNCLFSFNGLITFAPDWDEVIKWLPMEKIMVETDSPYMTPVPHRGKRNEPIFVKYVAEKIAKLKNIDYNEVARVSTENAIKFFGLDL